VIHIAIPMYNEAANVPGLFRDLYAALGDREARIICVDDGSSDGTMEAIAAARDGRPVTVVRHPRNLGLGAGINSGLRAALLEAADDDAIVMLEGDNTSDLGNLEAMLARHAEGYDVVVASPHAPGGGFVGVSRLRLVLSYGVATGFRIAGRIREVRTFSGVYRVYRAGTLRDAAETYGHLLIREPGFAACAELLLKLHNGGAKIVEVATTNDWTKRQGTSKMRIRRTILAYGRVSLAHLVGRIHPPPLSPLSEHLPEEPGRPTVTVLD
jgi:dolichol-phosphate mannosyltransferase